MNDILAIKTSDDTIELFLNNKKYQQQVGRKMSLKILSFIEEVLTDNSLTWQDLGGIITFRGEGGYTSLRIGITVANTLASSLKISIVGQTGQNWLSDGRKRLKDGQNDQIVTPIYKNPAIITKPKK